MIQYVAALLRCHPARVIAIRSNNDRVIDSHFDIARLEKKDVK